jgi:hypothetical protein
MIEERTQQIRENTADRRRYTEIKPLKRDH